MLFISVVHPTEMNFSDPQPTHISFNNNSAPFFVLGSGMPKLAAQSNDLKAGAVWLSVFLWMNLPFSNHDDLRYAVIFGKELSLNHLTWKFVGGLCSSIPKYIGYAAQLSTPVFVLK